MVSIEEIKGIVDDLGIEALETNSNIAAIAVVSDSGDLIHQTENIDLTNQTEMVFNLIQGDQSIIFNDLKFSVVEVNDNGIITTNEGCMGHMIFAPFEGGVLLVYAMPKANPIQVLSILQNYARRLDGKVS